MLQAVESCAICAKAYAIVVRLAYSALVLLLVAVVAFVGLRLAPGDVTTQILDPSRATPQELAFLRHQLGLDQPIYVQFFQYSAGLLHGDLGLSLITRETVTSIVATAGVYSISLAVAAFIVIFALAIPLGLAAAIWRGSAIDIAVRSVSGVLMATPNFVLAVVLINLLAVQAGWLPVAGSGSWKHIILPTLVLAAEPLGFATRLVRTSYLENAGAQYADAMRMRGLSEGTIRWRHIMRNALLPVISLAAVQVRTLVGYTLIVEIIFRWPGLGKRLVDSILTRDYQVAQGLTLLLAAVVVVATLVSSLLYRAADPRVRDE